MTRIMDDYLGDGVYAHFDGYHINLTTGDHRNPTLVALEPQVMSALKRYEERVEQYKKELKGE